MNNNISVFIVCILKKHKQNKKNYTEFIQNCCRQYD